MKRHQRGCALLLIYGFIALILFLNWLFSGMASNSEKHSSLVMPPVARERASEPLAPPYHVITASKRQIAVPGP